LFAVTSALQIRNQKNSVLDFKKGLSSVVATSGVVQKQQRFYAAMLSNQQAPLVAEINACCLAFLLEMITHSDDDTTIETCIYYLLVLLIYIFEKWQL
jgi:hypothetical protein